MMMRFANSYDNGLILRNEPVVEGIVPHEPMEFLKTLHTQDLKE